MKAVSGIGEHSIVWVVLTGFLASIDRDRRQAWMIAACTGPLSIILNFGLKVVVQRPRPDATPSTGRTSFSFPSAHAASSFAVATVAGRIESRLQKPALILAAWIAYSRIYLSRHYPGDVAAGGLLGFALGSAVGARLPKQLRLEA